MPNRYLPSELVEMVKERREQIAKSRGDGEYVPEHEALTTMLKEEYREEFLRRREKPV